MAGSIPPAFVQGCSPNAFVPLPMPKENKRFSMVNRMQFYIDGAWVDPVVKGKSTPVVNPATEEPMYEIALGSKADVDKAVAAATAATALSTSALEPSAISYIGSSVAGFTTGVVFPLTTGSTLAPSM